MRKAATLACLFLALGTAAARAEAPDCAALLAGLQGLPNYRAEVRPAAPEDGACVLDGARLASQSPGWPDLKVDRMRVGWGADWGSVDLDGLRATPKMGDREMADWLRQLVRLQTADLTARLVKGQDGTLRLTDFDLRLSGGTELGLELSLREVEMAFGRLPSGLVTDFRLDWRSDGRLLRPILEAVGEHILAGAAGDPVEAARDRLAEVVAALPAAALPGDSRRALEAAVAALPQGRGRLVLRLEAPQGIGPAGLALAALSDDPLGAEALARLLAGATLTADWQPGLQP